MDTFTLECFLAVAETGSFTKAAEKVKRTQSAVTQQVARLEKMLEKVLFIRGKHAVLTKEGEIFHGYALKIFSLHKELLDRFQTPELEGEIRFGLPEDFATMFLSDVLVDFSRAHPRVLLNVECDLTLNLLQKFKQGLLDLVLVKMGKSEEMPRGVQVMSESVEWVGKQELGASIDKQKPLPLALSPQPCVYRLRAIQALEQAGIRWRIVYTSPSYAGILASVVAGMGLTVLPRKLIPESLDILRHRDLPLLPDIHISLLKQENSSSQAVQTLEDHLLKKLH